MADIIIPSPAVTGEPEVEETVVEKTFFGDGEGGGESGAPPPPSTASGGYPPKANHVVQSIEEEGTDEGKAETKSDATGSTMGTVDDKNDWIDVLGNGLLLKKTLKQGDGVSTRPSPMSEVTMRILGSLPNGNVIDKHNSLRFIVSDGDVVQAVDIVVSLMQRGEICCVKADSKYAYGALGRSPNVPPSSPVMYELELLEVLPPLDLHTITESSLIQYLNKKRGRGNDLFQRKEYSQAVVSYGRAVKMIRDFRQMRRGESSTEINDLWIRCLNNLAAAQLKVEQYHEALESAREVLKCDPDNVKALYRCGKVLLYLDEVDESVSLLRKACELSPDEKAIGAELQKALRRQSQEKKSEKELYKRMISPNVNRTPKPSTGPSQSNRPSPSNSWGWKGIVLGAGIAALLAVGAIALFSSRK